MPALLPNIPDKQLQTLSPANSDSGQCSAAVEHAGVALVTQGRTDEALVLAYALTSGPMLTRCLGAIAIALARHGFGRDAVQTTKRIVEDRSEHLPRVAEALAEGGDRENLKRLLLPSAFDLKMAYRLSGLLAVAYPDQAAAIGAALHSPAGDIGSENNHDQSSRPLRGHGT